MQLLEEKRPKTILSLGGRSFSSFLGLFGDRFSLPLWLKVTKIQRSNCRSKLVRLVLVDTKIEVQSTYCIPGLTFVPCSSHLRFRTILLVFKAQSRRL